MSDSSSNTKQKAHTDLFSEEAIASLDTACTTVKSSSVTKKVAPSPPATRRKQDSLFDDDFLSGPPAKPTAAIDKIESEIAEETGPFSSKRGAAKVRFSLPVHDDLFESTKEPSTSKSGDRALFGQEPDELFATQKPRPASKTTHIPTDAAFATKPADDLFGEPPKLETKADAKIQPDIFAAPPEDVFSASASGKKTQDTDDIFSSTTVGQFGSGIKGSDGSKGLDDLFADATPKPKKASQSKEVVGGEESVDAGEPKLEPEKVGIYTLLILITH